MQHSDLATKRLAYSNATLGKSDDHDVRVLLKMLEEEVGAGQKILDVGCGAGDLTDLLAENFKSCKIFGTDIQKFSTFRHSFIKWDCNELASDELLQNQYDHVIVSHLILYIENPWEFMRQVAQMVKPGGKVLIANANTESFRSLICYYFRGYQISCPPNYPGHINSPSAVETSRMLERDDLFQIHEIRFSGKGRVPGFNINWQSIFPFLKGKRFSDAYFIKASRK